MNLGLQKLKKKGCARAKVSYSYGTLQIGVVRQHVRLRICLQSVMFCNRYRIITPAAAGQLVYALSAFISNMLANKNGKKKEKKNTILVGIILCQI